MFVLLGLSILRPCFFQVLERFCMFTLQLRVTLLEFIILILRICAGKSRIRMFVILLSTENS